MCAYLMYTLGCIWEFLFVPVPRVHTRVTVRPYVFQEGWGGFGSSLNWDVSSSEGVGEDGEGSQLLKELAEGPPTF